MSNNKFFHNEALTKVRKEKEREENLTQFVKESLDGVYETMRQLADELEERFKKLSGFGRDVESALSSTTEEILELNKYLKDTRQQVNRIMFKNRIRDLLAAGQAVVLLVLLLLVLTGCAGRSTIVYGHKSPLDVTDGLSKQKCTKVYSMYSEGVFTDVYAEPCNVEVTFQNRKSRPH